MRSSCLPKYLKKKYKKEIKTEGENKPNSPTTCPPPEILPLIWVFLQMGYLHDQHHGTRKSAKVNDWTFNICTEIAFPIYPF